MLLYDIEDDRLRTRIADICMDYGLERIQFSAFFGKLNRNRRQELALKLQNELGDESGRGREPDPLAGPTEGESEGRRQVRLPRSRAAHQADRKSVV